MKPYTYLFALLLMFLLGCQKSDIGNASDGVASNDNGFTVFEPSQITTVEE